MQYEGQQLTTNRPMSKNSTYLERLRSSSEKR